MSWFDENAERQRQQFAEDAETSRREAQELEALKPELVPELRRQQAQARLQRTYARAIESLEALKWIR